MSAAPKVQYLHFTQFIAQHHKAVSHFFQICRQQCHGSECGTTDSKSFADRGSGVSHGIQAIGTFAHFFGQIRHLCVSPGIISDGSKGVHSQSNSQCSQHTHGAKTDAVEPQFNVLKPTGEHKRDHDGSGDDDYRHGSR